MSAITVAEAAERLSTSGRNVRRMIQAGQLRATAVTPRMYLIEEGDVEAAKLRPGPGRPALLQNVLRELRTGNGKSR